MPALPFLTTGTLKTQGGTTVASGVPVSVWPVGGRHDSQSGQVYDHEGQADLDYVENVRLTNMSLTVDGVDYKIVSGIPFLHVPHIQLLLRVVVPGGGF